MIDEFVRSGVVVGMCGDGGNDCGALRTAHTGVALSEADASMVSPFTSKQKTPASVVDLLREGRGALHTSIAAYKYLIMYGLLFSVLKLSFYYYGVIMCQMAYFMTEGVAMILIPYAITLSLPAKRLGKVGKGVVAVVGGGGGGGVGGLGTPSPPGAAHAPGPPPPPLPPPRRGRRTACCRPAPPARCWECG